MIDPAYAVAKYILDAYSTPSPHAIGTFAASSGWSIGCGAYPDAPDTVIIVNHTGGLNPMPKIALDQPSVQILVRGAKSGYMAAKAKMLAIKDVLLGMNSQLLGMFPGPTPPAYAGDAYQNCVMISDILWLGQDENTRPHFSANFRFIVLPVATGNRVAIS